MSKKYSAKFLFSVVLSILSILGATTFAANPSFSISPASMTGKLHCEYILGMIINPWGLGYRWFETTIRFDSGNTIITPDALNPIFTTLNFAGISSWFLYNAYWNMGPWPGSTSIMTGLTFKFKTIQNILSTNLIFTNNTWGDIIFGPDTTDDGIYINALDNAFDILTWVNNASYTFVPLPCIVDTNAPGMLTNSNNPLNGATYIPYNHTISFVLYDWIGAWLITWPAPLGSNNRSHFWYSGANTILANYQAAPTTVDNQEWVNSGTIKVTLNCSGCVVWSRPYILSGTSLNRSDWIGNVTSNRYTRNSKTRWYNVSFLPPAQYEIEKLITVNVSVSDNANENGETHTGTTTFSFNAPQNPIITKISPTGNTNVPTNLSPVIFNFTDDWAGINTWTIKITIPQYSSWSKFYTWYTYSGNDLTITLIGWSVGTGNSWSYQVSFIPKWDFTSNIQLTITWYVQDLAGNIWTYNSSFTTMMNCADRWCSSIFQTTILWWLFTGTYPFTGSLIIVTGTNLNSIYPYLTGVNNDILMCWVPYTGAILTWNIWIFDTVWTQINGILYTWQDLYITWMDGLTWTLSGGVIIIQ